MPSWVPPPPGRWTGLASGTLSIAPSTRSTAAASNSVRDRAIVETRPISASGRSTTSSTCPAKSSSSSADGVACRHQVSGRASRSGLEVEVAELGDHQPFGREVVEGGLDHLLRVQVALGQHEGTGRGGVRGRVRVGGDEPDQVVVVVGAGEERAAVALHVVDVGQVGDVARVLGERVGQQVVGDRVELDRVDLTDAVGERRLDLVATGSADDQQPIGACGRAPPTGSGGRRSSNRAVVSGVPS